MNFTRRLDSDETNAQAYSGAMETMPPRAVLIVVTVMPDGTMSTSTNIHNRAYVAKSLRDAANILEAGSGTNYGRA